MAYSEDRKFTVNGAITPAMAPSYYFLSPALAKLELHVAESTFFMLYGTRGAGKTTAALHLLQRAASMYGVRPLKLDFSSIDIKGACDEFWRSIFLNLRGEAAKQNILLAPFDGVSGFVDAFRQQSLGNAKALLMLDEFDLLDSAADGIKEQVSLLSFAFLRMLWYRHCMYAPGSFVFSVPWRGTHHQAGHR